MLQGSGDNDNFLLIFCYCYHLVSYQHLKNLSYNYNESSLKSNILINRLKRQRQLVGQGNNYTKTWVASESVFVYFLVATENKKLDCIEHTRQSSECKTFT